MSGLPGWYRFAVHGRELMRDDHEKRTNLVDYVEAYDKNGHWFRLVPARGQTGWLWVERWASDHRYRLTAAKANMRVYRKEVGFGGIWHYVEIRLRESRLRVSSWMEVDGLARALRLFRLDPVIALEPFGFWGIRAKRTACRLLNDLLTRFEQDPIAGSLGFHLADYDPTTWLLFGLLSTISAVCLWIASSAAEWNVHLVDDNLVSFLKYGALLTGFSFALLVAYEKVVVRRWETLFPKISGMVAAVVFVTLAGWQLVSPAQLDLVQGRVRYHCIEAKNDDQGCRASMAALPESARARLAQSFVSRLPRIR